MSVLRDWDYLNHLIDTGRPIRDNRVRLREPSKEIPDEEGYHCSDEKFERCPGCGGLVIMPCLLCSLGE